MDGRRPSAVQIARPGSTYDIDASGNVTVVSGPGFYTGARGHLVHADRGAAWQRTVRPLSGRLRANWVVAAPTGDVIVLSSTSTPRPPMPYPVGMRPMARSWAIDPPVTIFRSSVGRLVVDAAGSTYVTYNNAVAKYSAAGVLLWTQTIPAGFPTSLAWARTVPTGGDGHSGQRHSVSVLRRNHGRQQVGGSRRQRVE